MASADVTDLTRGVYRRLYASYVCGKRINALSLNAEAWFWRVHASADDFGNSRGEDQVVYAATVGTRKGVGIEDVRNWLREMRDQDLVRSYEVDGESFLHIVGFVAIQPKARNGKRIKRVPNSPWDEMEETGCFRVNPGESAAIQHQHQHQHQHQDKPASQASTATADAATVAAPPAFLTFPCCAGKRSKSQTWSLTEEYVDELAEAFPAVEVRAECREALNWVRAKSANRKTADGMREFLHRWMKRSQNRGPAVWQAANGSRHGNQQPAANPFAGARRPTPRLDQPTVSGDAYSGG